MASLLISNGVVVTLGETGRVLPGHDVLCDGGVIAAIAPHDPARRAGTACTLRTIAWASACADATAMSLP